MFMYMQRWRVLVRQRDRPLLDAAMDELRSLHTRMKMKNTLLEAAFSMSWLCCVILWCGVPRTWMEAWYKYLLGVPYQIHMVAVWLYI
jgi:hypothetical protein